MTLVFTILTSLSKPPLAQHTSVRLSYFVTWSSDNLMNSTPLSVIFSRTAHFTTCLHPVAAVISLWCPKPAFYNHVIKLDDIWGRFRKTFHRAVTDDVVRSRLSISQPETCWVSVTDALLFYRGASIYTESSAEILPILKSFFQLANVYFRLLCVGSLAETSTCNSSGLDYARFGRIRNLVKEGKRKLKKQKQRMQEEEKTRKNKKEIKESSKNEERE